MLPLLMLGVLALVVGFIAAEVNALRNWNGAWRVGAAIPVVALLIVIARIVIDTSRDPTSHNLWPFEIIIWSGIGLAALGVLRLARPGGRVDAPTE